MPKRVPTDPSAQPPHRGAWRAYGLLAAAWLVLLGGGGVAGWLVHTHADRPVRTAELHSGALPEPPAPAAAERAGAIDPRFRQLATRDPGPAGLTDRPAAAADPPTATPEDTPDDTAATRAIPGLPAGGRQSDTASDGNGKGAAAPSADPAPASAETRSENPPAVQVAARTDGPKDAPATAGPMPPPVPRSIVSAPFGGAQAGTASRYSVQVGAFRLRENAVERAARLSAAGYEVRIVHVFATHSRLYMVRIGQFDARPAAMAYARQLARDVAVETWPVRN